MSVLQYTGLTSNEAKALLVKYGSNSLPTQKKNIFKKFLTWVISPVSLMLLAAAILSFFNDSITNFLIIIVLFFSNFLITVWHERKADRSIEKLQQHLTFKVQTLRDNIWVPIDSKDLVIGDVIELKIGSTIPADVRIIQAVNLTIDESVLTGESLTKIKNINDTAYAGSFVATGQGIGEVTATGSQTNFGTVISLVDKISHKSALEKDILLISKFISIISISIIVLLTGVLFIAHENIARIATLDLSLLIAGIPVALPTVMSLIISAGVVVLAKKDVVVRRLASLEDLANVDLLLSDKTGTLTENKIHVEKIIPIGEYSEPEVIAIIASATNDIDGNAVGTAILRKAKELHATVYQQISCIPGDSERKRNTAVLVVNGQKMLVSVGASQVIMGLCSMTDIERVHFEKIIDDASTEGYRTHVLAVSHSIEEEKNMKLAGVLLLSDKIRVDARDTIAFMRENGIETKMITGDNIAISRRVTGDLGLVGNVYSRSILDEKNYFDSNNFKDIACVAEVLPKDKYNMVIAAERYYSVAVTGDGVNDLPAIKAANVGFAVANAVDALKSTADIVLLSDGIFVIKDAIIEARKIFMRLYNYSVYRISESFRVIVTIAVIGLIYKTYPLTPVQLIILAFLNDVPIVSLAFDRVKTLAKPAHINARARFTRSILFGLIGVLNSLIFLYIMIHFLHLPWVLIQTVFFLKLTVSGHMLVYVAHTEEVWYKFLPSRSVIISTLVTQLIATALALFGVFIANVSVGLILFVWVWSFIWMQISEIIKTVHKRFS